MNLKKKTNRNRCCCKAIERSRKKKKQESCYLHDEMLSIEESVSEEMSAFVGAAFFGCAAAEALLIFSLSFCLGGSGGSILSFDRSRRGISEREPSATLCLTGREIDRPPRTSVAWRRLASRQILFVL